MKFMVHHDNHELVKGINFEISMICCGFNLHKYHLKSRTRTIAA